MVTAVVWKGFWEILDDVYETYKWRVSMGITGGILAYLLVIGSLRTVMGTPLGTGYFVDIDDCYLYIQTMWQMEVPIKNPPLFHLLLLLFSLL